MDGWMWVKLLSTGGVQRVFSCISAKSLEKVSKFFLLVQFSEIQFLPSTKELSPSHNIHTFWQKGYHPVNLKGASPPQVLSFRKCAQVNDKLTLQCPEPQELPHYSNSKHPNTYPESGSSAMQPFAKNNRTAETRSMGEKLKESEEQMGQWEGRRHILTNSSRLFYLSEHWKWRAGCDWAAGGADGMEERLKIVTKLCQTECQFI